MKIIYLHQYFNTPLMKGGTRSFEMAKRMVRRGHEVHMITSYRSSDSNKKSKAWRKECIDGINVHWLPVHYDNRMSYWNRLMAFFAFAMKAGERAIQEKGDIIFATSTPLTIAIPAVKAKRKLNVPLVFEVRDLWPELPIAMGALKSPVTKFLARKLEKYAYFNSEHVVGLSPGMSEGIRSTGYPSKRVSTIPNSCDLELFSVPDSEGKAFRRARLWLGEKPLVLYAGTLGHINGVSWLAHLAVKVRELNPDIRFLVLGEGVDEEKIKSEAAELGVLNHNFFMENQLPKNEVPSALNAATLCASLFIPVKEMWANSANKFFDSLAAGRPVMINYEGWQKTLIEDYDTGLCLDHNDINSSAHKVASIIADSNRCERLGRNARKLAEEEFSRDELASDLIDVLEQVGMSENG